MKAFALFFLTGVTIAKSAGFADMTVQNIVSAGQMQQNQSSSVVATAYTDSDSVDLGTKTHKIDFAHQCVIEITFRDVGEVPSPQEYVVEWFFLSKDVNTKARKIFDAGSKAITASSQVTDVVSKAVSEHRTASVSTVLNGTTADSWGNVPVTQSASRSKSGSKIEGWIVRLRSGDRILKTEASLSELKDLSESSEFSSYMSQVLGSH